MTGPDRITEPRTARTSLPADAASARASGLGGRVPLGTEQQARFRASIATSRRFGLARRLVALIPAQSGYRAVYYRTSLIEKVEPGNWDVVPVAAWAAFADDSDENGISFPAMVYDSDLHSLVKATEWAGEEALFWGVVGPDDAMPDIAEWRRMHHAHRMRTERNIYQFYLLSATDTDPSLHILPTDLMKAGHAHGLIIDDPDFVRRTGTVELRRRGYAGGGRTPVGLIASVGVHFDESRYQAEARLKQALADMGRTDITVSEA